MAKYFMGDTKLGSLERMMMDPSRSVPSPKKRDKRRNIPASKPERKKRRQSV